MRKDEHAGMIDHLIITVAGLRPGCQPKYHGTFDMDPDGNNIEALCRQHG